MSIVLYHEEHEEKYPVTLSTLMAESGMSNGIQRLLRCPGNYAPEQDHTRPDYLYIDWTQWFGTNVVPPEYPLLYDRQFSNHAGQGINIVRIDATRMWDPNAKWLIGFAAKNPKFKIVLPQ